MKKLTLTLDDLQVDSFSTMDDAVAHEKTVRAYISLQSCSCVECVTATDCETGCCGTRYEGGTCDYPTCVPTCAGWTCEYQTCNGC